MSRHDKKQHNARLAWIQSMAALHGLTFADIARKANVSRQFVYAVAAGKKKGARVEKYIARELGITIEALRRIA